MLNTLLPVFKLDPPGRLSARLWSPFVTLSCPIFTIYFLTLWSPPPPFASHCLCLPSSLIVFISAPAAATALVDEIVTVIVNLCGGDKEGESQMVEIVFGAYEE